MRGGRGSYWRRSVVEMGKWKRNGGRTHSGSGTGSWIWKMMIREVLKKCTVGSGVEIGGGSWIVMRVMTRGSC